MRRGQQRRERDAVPRWLLTLIAGVAFALWVIGWIAEAVAQLRGGEFKAPEGALSLLMLILGGTLATDKLFNRGKRAISAAADALRNDEEGDPDADSRTR